VLRKFSALLAVPSKASGGVPNSLAVEGVAMGAVDTGGVGCCVRRAGAFPLEAVVITGVGVLAGRGERGDPGSAPGVEAGVCSGVILD
jgi:hypothetical protein